MRKPRHKPLGAHAGPLAAEQAVIVDALVSSGALSDQSLARVIDLIGRFCLFCEQGFDVRSISEITAVEAKAFIGATTPFGEPAVSTTHLRRSVLRILFRTARCLGLAHSDPTLDLVLPARTTSSARPLTDEEVALCRTASLHSLTATRLPAAWALAESSARTSELGLIRVDDVDLESDRVWLPGSTRVEARWAPLTGWGCIQLERRLRRAPADPARPLVYDGDSGSDYHRQAASCVAVTETMRRAGVAGEPDVRPVSVAAWAGRRVLAETGQIEEVARRLGVRSLDRAAALIGWDWTTGQANHVG